MSEEKYYIHPSRSKLIHPNRITDINNEWRPNMEVVYKGSVLYEGSNYYLVGINSPDLKSLIKAYCSKRDVPVRSYYRSRDKIYVQITNIDFSNRSTGKILYYCSANNIDQDTGSFISTNKHTSKSLKGSNMIALDRGRSRSRSPDRYLDRSRSRDKRSRSRSRSPDRSRTRDKSRHYHHHSH